MIPVQPAVTAASASIMPFRAEARNNTGSGRAVISPPDPADDVALRATGRRVRRHQRRAEQPQTYELWALDERGHEMRHRSTLEAVRRIADELRAEGFTIRWFPTEARDYPAWNWRAPPCAT